jgi:hypothetical protein
MKKIFLASVVAQSVLSASAAMSAEVPAQYRGLWCWSMRGTGPGHRCRDKEINDSSRAIGRDYIDLIEANENDCTVVAVKRRAKGHRLYVACNDGPVDVDLWLDARKRLHW